MIDKNTIIIRVDANIAETDFEDKIVLLHIENGEYYNFNETGSDLWRWLKAEHAVHSLVNKVSEKYDCTVEECLPDVIAWVNECLAKQIIKIV